MHKDSKRTSRSKSKGFDPLKLFGPPPLLYGEDEAAYEEMVARISNALGPRDFIEEIWVQDLVNVAWNIGRLRRIQAAFLDDNIWKAVNDKASSLVEDNPKLMQGTEQEKKQMERLLEQIPFEFTHSLRA